MGSICSGDKYETLPLTNPVRVVLKSKIPLAIPKIKHFHGAIEGQKNIVGRDIAVHETHRATVFVDSDVRGVQCERRLRDDVHRDVFVDHHVFGRQTREGIAHAQTFEKLHREIRAAVFGARSEQPHDVWVHDERGQTRFAKKRIDEFALARRVRRGRFLRRLRGDCRIERAPDFRHPALANAFDQVIGTEIAQHAH